MTNYWGTNSNSVSTLFSSLNTSGVSGMTSLFSDYNSIRNGSYGKLLKNYYNKAVSGTSADKSRTSSEDIVTKLIKERQNPKVSKEVSEANAALNKGVSSIKDSISALQKSSTYQDTVGGQNAKDKVGSAVKNFVADYNEVVKSAKKSTNRGATSNVASMMRSTEANADKLAEIGITKNSDGTISLDEKKLKSADISKVESLFSADNTLSYGSTIASRIRGAGYYSTTSQASGGADAATAQETRTKSSSLKEDVASLSSDALYAKVKDAEGKETDKYDVDKITSKAKSFVNNYNETISSAKLLKNSGVTSNLSYMMDKTSKNADALKELGIAVNKNGTLSIDEDTFKKADMSKVKDVFKNYGSSISTNVSLLNYYSSTQANAANSYNANGTYNAAAASNFTDVI